MFSSFFLGKMTSDCCEGVLTLTWPLLIAAKVPTSRIGVLPVFSFMSIGPSLGRGMPTLAVSPRVRYVYATSSLSVTHTGKFFINTIATRNVDFPHISLGRMWVCIPPKTTTTTTTLVSHTKTPNLSA
jgi:hypothetical protein